MLNLSLKRNMPHLFRDKESFLIKKDIYLLSIGTCFNYNCSSFDFITVLRRLIVHIFLQWIYCSANCYFQLQRFKYFVIMIIFLKMVTFEIWSPISSDGCCIVRRIDFVDLATSYGFSAFMILPLLLITLLLSSTGKQITALI